MIDILIKFQFSKFGYDRLTRIIVRFIFTGRLSSQDDLDDEASSIYSPSTCGAAGKLETDFHEHLD